MESTPTPTCTTTPTCNPTHTPTPTSTPPSTPTLPQCAQGTSGTEGPNKRTDIVEEEGSNLQKELWHGCKEEFRIMQDKEHMISWDGDYMYKGNVAEGLELIIVEEKILIMNILYKKRKWWFCNTE